MLHRTPLHGLAGLAVAFAISPSASGQVELTGDDYASVDTEDGSVGPNVGSQPRTARDRLDDDDEAGEDAIEEPESGVWVSLGIEYTTAYYSRGFLYEDEGLILQPWAEVGVPVWDNDEISLELIFGVWNSWQDKATDAGTNDSTRENWYESDLYLGLGIATGNWYFEAEYYWYVSPSDAWESIQEVYFSAAYDDSEALGAWSMQPTAVLAIETDNANDGYARGTYLQLGVSPGFMREEGTLEGLEITFPVSVGLSLSNYYEGDDGENDFFGFASVGVTATRALSLDESWGEWSVYAGVQALFLGDMASTWNDGDDLEAILTVGVSAEF